MHFAGFLALAEYGPPNNCSGAWGEKKHREPERDVVKTNKRQPLRQVMAKEAFRVTIDAMRRGAYRTHCPAVLDQVMRLQASAPSLMPGGAPADDSDDEEDDDDVAAPTQTIVWCKSQNFIEVEKQRIVLQDWLMDSRVLDSTTPTRYGG